MEQKQECTICYKIICRECGWEPNEHELIQIQQGELTACPDCGWKHGETV